MGRDVDRGKIAYIWISLDPMKVGPTLRGDVVAVVLMFPIEYNGVWRMIKKSV